MKRLAFSLIAVFMALCDLDALDHVKSPSDISPCQIAGRDMTAASNTGITPRTSSYSTTLQYKAMPQDCFR